ncbi:MAG: hypothetical protein BMS9Abin37_2138 [Acidobacteriota bacterium]|nr:MAG: hypothetical protein BMS9Abin37_2138 [Acidobacteriota bacterium]
MALEEFFAIAIPLVDAVATAHKMHITHRDPKPANVMLTAEHQVTVLDFRLALSRRSAIVAADSNTPTAMRTTVGAIVGTLQYMSPEQAEGKPVEHRSDIFSLGVILYEMLTGGLPFRGDSALSILSSILTATQTPVVELRPDKPSALCDAVEKCLAKRPRDRYQHALDLKAVITAVRDQSQPIEAGTETTPSGNAGRKKLSCTFSLAIGITTASVLVVGLMQLETIDPRPKACERELEIADPRRFEISAILSVLATYESAIEAKNIELFRKVKPNITPDEEKQLRDSFARTDSHEVELTLNGWTVTEDEAILDVARTDTIVLRGQSQTDRTRRRQTFRLRRTESGWLIVFIGKARDSESK